MLMTPKADDLAAKQYLSTGDASAISGMAQPKIRRLCEIGRLPAVNVSTGTRPRWMIRRVDLEAFLTPTAVQEKEKTPRATRRRRIDEGVERVFG